MGFNYQKYVSGNAKLVGGIMSGSWGTALSSIGDYMGIFGSSNSASKAAAQQYQYNLSLQKQAQDWNEYMYKNRYQMQREDLEKAGINPLYGLGNAPSVTSGTNSVGMADMVGEQNNKFQQMMSLLDFGQNLSAKRAETKLLENQANTEAVNTGLKTLEYIKEQYRLKDLPKERELELKQLETNVIKNLTDIEYTKTQNKLAKTTEKASAREYALEQEWDKEHPYAKGWATAFRRFGIGIGANLSGSASASRVHK